jgi:hypothetical protein
MVLSAARLSAVATASGVNGQQIVHLTIVYGQVVIQKARHIFKLHSMAHIGAVTLQMVFTK